MNILLYFLFCYLLGNLLTAKILGKFVYKSDIGVNGSGNPGARNAGRLYGKTAFILTFLGDALKGVLAVLAGVYLDMAAIVITAGLLFTVIGHIKPVLYKFNGGKGVSSLIGGMLTLEPLLVLHIIIVFILLYFILKSFTLAGLLVILIAPVTLFLLNHELKESLMLLVICIIVSAAHKNDVQTFFSSR